MYVCVYVCVCMCVCVCVRVCVCVGMSSASEVQRALEQVAHNWMELGICFGISYDLMEPLGQGDPQRSLAAVVQLWLGERYDSAAFGRPSWRKLVEVVGWRCGACNPSLAESIAKQHEGESVACECSLTATLLIIASYVKDVTRSHLD